MMYNHGRMNSGGNEEETDTLPAPVEAGKVYSERLGTGLISDLKVHRGVLQDQQLQLDAQPHAGHG